MKRFLAVVLSVALMIVALPISPVSAVDNVIITPSDGVIVDPNDAALTKPSNLPLTAGERVITTFDEADAAVGRNYYREDGATSDTYLPQNKAYAYADEGTTVNAEIVDGELALEYTEVALGKYATAYVFTDPQQNQNITADTGMLVFHLDTTGVVSMEAGTSFGIRLTMNRSNGYSGASVAAFVLNSKTVYFKADGSDVLEERMTRPATSVWNCYLDVNVGESGTYYIPIDAFLSDEANPLTDWTFTQADLDQLIIDQAESWRHNSTIGLNFRCADISANDVILLDDFKWTIDSPLDYKYRYTTEDFSEFYPNFNWTWTYGNLSGYSNTPDGAVTRDEISVIDDRFAVTPNNTATDGMRFTITLDEIGSKWEQDFEAFAFDLDLSETTGNMTGRFKFVGRTRVATGEDTYSLEVATFAVYNGTIYFVAEDGDVTPVVMTNGNSNTQWDIPDGFKGTVIIPADIVKKDSGAETATIYDDYTEFGFQYELLNWNAADNGASVYVDNLGYYTNKPIFGEHVHQYDDPLDDTCNICEEERDVSYVGWVLDDGGWRYYENGALFTNTWVNDGYGRYYLGDDGYIVKNNWIIDQGNRYYIGNNGYVVTDSRIEESGGICYVDKNGVLKTNTWVSDSIGKRYIGSDGYVVFGQWFEDGYYLYYLNSDGYAATGYQTIDGLDCYFNYYSGQLSYFIADGIKYSYSLGELSISGYETKPTGELTFKESIKGYNVTKISSYAFSGNTGITNVIVPNGVRILAYEAFYGCSNLQSVSLPSTLEEIYTGAFGGCSALTDVWYSGNIPQRNSIILNSGNSRLENATWHYTYCSGEHTYSYICDDVCDYCGYIREDSADHSYSYVCDAVCDVCGSERYIAHSWETEYQTDFNYHWRECVLCHEFEEGFEPHVYDNAYDNNCNVCGHWRDIVSEEAKWPTFGTIRSIATFNETDATLGVNYNSAGYYPERKAYVYADTYDYTSVNSKIMGGKLKVQYTGVTSGYYATVRVYTDPDQRQNMTSGTDYLAFHLNTTGVTSMGAGDDIKIRLTLNRSNGTSGSSAAAFVLDNKVYYFQADGTDYWEERRTERVTSVWDSYLNAKVGESGTYYIPVSAFITDSNSSITDWNFTQSDWNQLVTDQATSWRHNSSVDLNIRSNLAVGDVLTFDDFEWTENYSFDYKYQAITEDFSDFIPNFNWTWPWGNYSAYSNEPGEALTKDDIFISDDGRFAVTPNAYATDGTRFTVELYDIGNWKEEYDAIAFDIDLSEISTSKTTRIKFRGRDGENSIAFAPIGGTIYFVAEDGSVDSVDTTNFNESTQISLPAGFKGMVLIPKDCLTKTTSNYGYDLHSEYEAFSIQYEILSWDEADNGATYYIDNFRYYSNTPVYKEHEHVYSGVLDEICDVCGDEREITYTGWIEDDYGWIYYSNGNQVFGQWINDSIGWCFINASGYRVTNSWVQDSNCWYYFGEDGYMLCGQWLEISGYRYYLDDDGHMVTGWYDVDGERYYFGNTGDMVSEAWVDGIYYLDASGHIVTGTVMIDGKYYVFGDDGVWTNESYYEEAGFKFVENEDGTFKLIGCSQEKTGNLYIPATPLGYELTIIGEGAFAGYKSVTSVDMPDGVTVIMGNAFNGCEGLTMIILPDSIEEIGENAFAGCNSLTDVWYAGSESDWQNITVMSGNDALSNATWHYNTCLRAHVYDAECDADCNNCEWVRTEVQPHSYDSICDEDCNGCGVVREDAHIWEETYRYNDVEHWTSCFLCGAVKEPEQHNYDNGCDTNCNTCNAQREITHQWGPAYSYNDDNHWAICDVCGEDSSEVSSHEFDSTDDHGCNVCRYYSVAPAPQVAKITNSRVELVFSEIYEYSIDGINWQSSNVFKDLKPETEYTFYCRVAATDTHDASKMSLGTVVTTLGGYMAGDYNNDEIVNADDAVYLLYYINYGGEDYPIIQPADINGDGIENADDAIYLLYHTLFGDEYPLA